MNINNTLKSFNAWWDDFILELIKPVAILSMGLGTIGVFCSLLGLAISPWYVLTWAIVQSLSIDGLFFATWDRLFSISPKKSNVLAIIALAFIGLFLALVAIAINTVLGFQVLWSIADSQLAMTRLGISSSLFTTMRAVLAVIVFIMVSFVRTKTRVVNAIEQPTIATAKCARNKPVVTIQEQKPLAIPEIATTHNDVLDTLTIKPESKYDVIKEAMAMAKANGEKINLKAISQQTGAGYSTVKLYAKDIKKELDQASS